MAFSGKNDGGVWVDEAGVPRSAEYVIAKLSDADRAALDAASGSYASVALYSGATTAGKAVGIVCTAAGTATFTFANGGTLTLPVAVGFSLLPFACTNVTQTTGTMTLYKLT